jgi:LacI family transcriptional regulator
MARTKTTNRHVGILVETEDTWGRNIVESVCRFGQQCGWTVLISPRDRHGKLRVPNAWNGHGVIAALRNRSMTQHVKRLAVPVVDVSSTSKRESWFARVQTDDRTRARLAVEHLADRGIRHFACYTPSIGRYSDQRAHEFRAAVEATGGQCVMFESQAAGWLTNYSGVRDWLKKLPTPVGIFAGDPQPARQLVEVCAMNSLRVPDDISIISGDDDDLLCNVASPQISSIELASHHIGETAAGVLQRLMNGASIPRRTKLIPPLGIRARQSTDTLAVDDPDLVSALRYIRQHASEGIDVSDVARAALLSRRSLEQRFRKTLNCSPGEEIRRTRLELVRQLLLDTEKSIEAIAFETGFASGASLSQAFQKRFGIPPGTLRRNAATRKRLR